MYRVVRTHIKLQESQATLLYGRSDVNEYTEALSLFEALNIANHLNDGYTSAWITNTDGKNILMRIEVPIAIRALQPYIKSVWIAEIGRTKVPVSAADETITWQNLVHRMNDIEANECTL